MAFNIDFAVNDPWKPLQNSLARLSQTYDEIEEKKRRKKQDELDDMRIEEARMSIDDLRNVAGQKKEYRGSLSGLATPEEREAKVAEMAGAGNEYAGEQLPKVRSITDELLKRKAEAGVSGDRETYFKSNIMLEQMGKASEILEKSMKVDPTGNLAKQQIAANPELFQNVDPETIKFTQEGAVFEVKDPQSGQILGHSINTPDGKWHFKEVDKPQALSDFDRWRLNPGEFAQYKSVGSSAGTNQPPSGYKYADNGNLVFIPGGPADPSVKSVREQPTKALPASQVESLLDIQNVAKALKEATEIADAKSVDTGPISGRWQAFQSKFGMASDSFVDMNQRLQTANNIMLKLRSGAAVTESEYNRFINEFPQPTDTPDVRKRKAKNSIRYMNSLIDDKVSAFSESGYKTPTVKPVDVPGEQGQKPEIGMNSSSPTQPVVTLPPAAVSQLQPGKVTTFRNGQRWTMGADGQPQQVQ